MSLNKTQIPVLNILLLFLSMLPVTMIVPVFKDIIKDKLGGDSLSVSFFMSSAMLGSFLFSPVAGFLSDKFQTRKWFIVVFSILDGLSFFLLKEIEQLNILQMVRFGEGVCHIFVVGLLLSSIVDRENDETNPRFFRKGILLGLAGMFLSLGVGLGSPMGILGRKNPELPFVVAGWMMIGIGILSFFFLQDYESIHRPHITFNTWKQALQKNKLILIPSIYNFIDRFTVGFFVTSFNLHLREGLGLGAGQVGLYLALVLIPMSLLSYPFAMLSKKTGPTFLMMLGSVIYGSSLAVAGFLDSQNLLFLFLLFTGVGAGVMFVPSMILVSKLSPSGYNASVMAGFTGFGSIGFMLGPICSVLLERFLQLEPGQFGIISLLFGGLEILVVLITIPFYRRLTHE